MPYYSDLYEHDTRFRTELLSINDGYQLLGEETRNGKTILWSWDKKRKWFRLKIPNGW